MKKIDHAKLIKQALFVGVGAGVWTYFLGPPGIIPIVCLCILGAAIFQTWKQ